MKQYGTIAILFLVTLLWLSACANQQTSQLTVSAASNLIPAFEEIKAVFEAQTGISVVYNFGGSGKLAQQIEQGAPVDVFASADANYVTRLVEGGHIDATSQQTYAQGRIVIWSGNPKLLPQIPQDLISPQIERVAIANPNHAPYGVIAQEVLKNSGVWQTLQPKLIMGDDVRQTLTYAQTGDVSVALVPLSLVINLDEGAYTLIPPAYHTPIIQSMGISSDSVQKDKAQQFINFVLSNEGQAILQKYGYEKVK